MATQHVIRNATRADVPTILALMRATAAEQGVPENVKATEADMLASIDFADAASETQQRPQHSRQQNGRVLLLVAPEGDIAGMASYFFTYLAWKAKSGICLEDLFVLERFRRRGYARMLVRAVTEEAREAGCPRVEWQCYSDNEPALRFYRSLGAVEMGRISTLRLEGDPIEALATAPDTAPARAG